jgi:gliding motility-associated-like protein
LICTPGAVSTSGSGTSTIIGNLATGTYTYTVSNIYGCISGASQPVVIDPQPPTPAAPVPGTITSPTCALPTGSVILNGLPATGTWTLTRFPGTVKTTGVGTSTTISNLSPSATYNFTVTNAGECISTASSNVFIPAEPPKPTPPGLGTITQPTCNVPTGSVILTGLPAGIWTINPGNISGSGSTTTISGLVQGTYNFTVTNSIECTSVLSSNIVILAQPATPNIIITNPPAVCSPSRVNLTSSDVTVGSTAGLIFTYWTNSSATIAYATPAAAAAGTYYIKGTTSSGCYDIKPVISTINPLPTANAGTGGSECDLDFVFNAVPSIGVGTWTKTTGPATGIATFLPDANSATATVTVSEYGTYTFTWTEVSNDCSKSSVVTVVFRQQPVANPGAGGNNCGLSYVFSAVPSIGTGTWTKTSGVGTVTFSPNANAPNARVTVPAYGQYAFAWTEVNGTCTNSATINVNFLQLPVANAGIDGSACGLNFTLNAIPGTGSGLGTWTKASGPGDAVFSPDLNQSGAKVSVNQFGTYRFAWNVMNGTCTSSDTVSVLFRNFPALSAGKDTVICKGQTYQLQAQGVGSFLWTPAALLSNPAIVNPVASPLTATLFTVTITDQFGCKNSDDIMIRIWDKPNADAGPDQVLQYILGTNLDAAEPGLNEKGTWSVKSGSAIFEDTSDGKTSVSGLSVSENILLWSVTNGVCPVSTDSVTISVEDLLVPTLITPNMDGKNDYFVLRGIETLGKTELIIFDRRGARVFRNENYDNQWNGLDYNGNPLFDDTYFYVLKAQNGKSLSGYIVIRR